MAKVPSVVPGFRSGTALAYRCVAPVAAKDGGISRQRRATGLAARSTHQARSCPSARRTSRDFGQPGGLVWGTAFARIPSGRAANLGGDGTKKTVIDCTLPFEID